MSPPCTRPPGRHRHDRLGFTQALLMCAFGAAIVFGDLFAVGVDGGAGDASGCFRQAGGVCILIYVLFLLYACIISICILLVPICIYPSSKRVRMFASTYISAQPRPARSSLYRYSCEARYCHQHGIERIFMFGQAFGQADANILTHT